MTGGQGGAGRVLRALWRAAVGLGVLGVLGALVAGTVWLGASFDSAATRTGADELTMSFGLSRETEASSVLRNVCRRRTDVNEATFRNLVENAAGQCVDSRKVRARALERKRAGDDTARTTFERPGIVSATPGADLTPCPATPDPGDAVIRSDLAAVSSNVFPSDQLTATAALVGTTGLKVTVTGTPSAPTDVRSGEYCGTVVVERDGASTETFAIRATLNDRGGRALAFAVVVLAWGALAGVLLRFLNDPVSRLVPLYRRLRSLRRWASSLPQDETWAKVDARLIDAEDAMSFFDAEAAAAALKDLDDIRAAPSDPAASERADQMATTPGRVRQPERRSGLRVLGMFRWYWLVALLAVVAAVVAAGLTTQYVDDASFAGSQRDWWSLAVFGLAAQVTASTLGESLGRLTPSGRPD